MNKFVTSKENIVAFMKSANEAGLFGIVGNLSPEEIFEIKDDRFTNTYTQSLFDLYCAAQLNKGKYVLGEGRTIVGRATLKDSGIEGNIVSIEDNITPMSVGVPVDNEKVNETLSKIFIHAKSPEHAEKIYNAILDR